MNGYFIFKIYLVINIDKNELTLIYTNSDRNTVFTGVVLTDFFFSF